MALISDAAQKGSNKRVAKRYTYLPQARLEAQEVQQTVQIRNISASGIQFFSNLIIQSNAPLQMTWEDEEVGLLEPYLLTIRKLEQTHKGLFRYVYGSKFVNLKHETKSNLEKLVQLADLHEKEYNKKFIKSVSLHTILAIFKLGRSHLNEILKGEHDAKKFHRFTRDIPDYEKKSFDADDDTSQYVQKLTTHDFHCNLLNVVIPFIPKNNADGFELYKEAVKKIELFSHTVIEAKKFSASAEIQESKNRLYYNNLDLIHTFIETYEKQQFSSDMKDSFQKIAKEYFTTTPQKPKK